MAKVGLIERRVELAREQANPTVIGKLSCGWLVLGDRQVHSGILPCASRPSGAFAE